jgi:ribosomal protein S18 acetylase RimI-like enzyme
VISYHRSLTVTFLPLTPPEIPRVLERMAQLYHAGGYDEDRQRKGVERLLSAPDLGGVWLIQAEGEAVGYIVLTVGYSLEFHGQYALLDELFIDAAWRSRGIGSEALVFAELWSRDRGFQAIRLEVGHHNPGALRLYRRHGFDAPDRHLLSKEFLNTPRR